MSLTKCEVVTDNIQNLPNSPALSPDELKQTFDKTGKDLKDYINDKLIPEVENNIKRSEDNIKKQIKKEYKYSVILEGNIEKNTDYTIPSTYTVNTSNLDIFYEGSLLTINENYVERGTGESNKVRFDWDVPKGSKLDFVIRN